MTVVLDASAAMEIALNNSEAENFNRILAEAELILAPDIYPSEITNVFWKYGNFSKLAVEKCEAGIEYSINLIDDFVDTKSMCHEVLQESLRFKHSSYDIFYLIVARRNNGYLLSKDKRLLDIAEILNIKNARNV